LPLPFGQGLKKKAHTIAPEYDPQAQAVVYEGDCLDFLATLPDESVQLVVTSPPYNIGKEYERRVGLDDYLSEQRQVIRQCVRVLKPAGHICWQVGNFTDKGAIVPLDAVLYPVFAEMGLRMRNRIVWHFEHGLHCKKRFSGRYETINWFTKTDDYFFDLDPVRVPQKYPGKRHFKGPKAGQYSCNPQGKNPGDVWTFPNVKSNHVEKTDHPCQFPIELVLRLVRSMTREGDAVLDPFLGVGSTVCAAVMEDRRGLGAEVVPAYADIARQRIEQALAGDLAFRPPSRPVFDPNEAGRKVLTAPWLDNDEPLYPE
jgi:adenine-specific DNA-methyltransferase